MAADGTSIKNDIDNDLANKGYRGIRIATIITTLKKLVDWVSSAVANNVSTWLRSSDNVSGGANNEAIYRTGLTEFRGGANAIGRDPGAALVNTVFGQAGLQVIGSEVNKPAYMEFHVRGRVIHQLGVDADGVLKFRDYNDQTPRAIFVDGMTSNVKLAKVLLNRKVVLYEGAANDHQFFGFGVNGGALLYQVIGTTDSHVFRAGLSPASSVEVMRIQGDGKVGIGIALPAYPLDVSADNPTGGIVARFSNSHGAAGGNGLLLSLNQSGIAIWLFGQPAGQDAFVINGWANGTNPERLRINASGYVGIGTSAPTSTLHVKGATGYQQLRLETAYIPTGPTDSNGEAGTVCWGEDYIYWKTSTNPHRWRRAASSGW